MACTKMAKMELENTKLPVCLKQFFMFPEHCAFCLCEVLTRCHRYISLIIWYHVSLTLLGSYLLSILFLYFIC